MNRWLVPVLCAVVLALVCVQVFFIQNNRAFQRNVASELAAVKTELAETREENRELRAALEELQSSDLDVIVEEAGDALVTGWNSMLDVLESELRKAEEAMRERRERNDSKSETPQNSNPPAEQ
ncbi:septal ring factor EnvC (AmiA/AmiB activator) [Litorivivens lipolytica]|uniref:Septal ring factor EnvC (AmiA/AmiB activator) n=1 Tax=Litorivivens lipolytica TaxID=1524264 RepID=A0A7W4W288_9GAMM|nr:hypothetical protein [Litorivivens lipolytica]MBB3046105.1 septal ring factor EnvC (AmiA/AmiB activator) [Litorivivens lipolytica]